MEAIFLHPDEPELEFEGFLKKRSPKVRYFQGSLMCGEDLDRTQVDKAEAVSILTNKYSQDPDADDASNIMRVIAVKDYCEDTRVIIQLLLYHNKSYLLNIPSWDETRDAVVCLVTSFSVLQTNYIDFVLHSLNSSWASLPSPAWLLASAH